MRKSKGEASKRQVCPDRLSELPDSLILSILSLIEMRDVVTTTLLSKRWKDLWVTVPCLDFCWYPHPKFICGVLANWKGAKILKFSIDFFEHTSPSSEIDSWLLFAIEKQVEELFIDVRGWRDINGGRASEYCAPQRLYSFSSIAKLSLSDVQLKIEENVRWNRLKSLTIENVMSLSEDAMNQVFSGAPHLEELILRIRDFSEDLNIRSRSLKMLQIGRRVDGYYTETALNAGLRIWAPNLSTLEIYSFIGGSCLFDVPSLANAVLYLRNDENPENTPLGMFNQVLRSIRHVEKLTLSDWFIQLLLYMKKIGVVVPLSNVKFLKLSACETEEKLDVLEIFPKLMTMILVDPWDKGRYLTIGEMTHRDMVDACNSLASEMTFPTPSLLQLKTVDITWSICDTSIIPMIESLLEKAHVLEKMVLRLRMHGAYPETFILVEEKVLSMPRCSPIAQVIIIKD